MSSLRQIYVHVYIRMHASFVSCGKGVAVHHLTGEAMETAASSWVLSSTVVFVFAWCSLNILRSPPINSENLIQKVHDPLYAGLKDFYCIHVSLKVMASFSFVIFFRVVSLYSELLVLFCC